MMDKVGQLGKVNADDSKYALEGSPTFSEALPLGIQHVFTMFVSNLVPMLLVAQAANLDSVQTTILLQAAMLGAGIATLIQQIPVKIGQKYQIGSGLACVMGMTYVFMPTLISLAEVHPLPVIFGAQLVGGLVGVLFGVLFDKISRFFPPIVTGTVVLSLGLSIFDTAVTNLAGGAGSATFGAAENWIVGIVVAVTIVVAQEFGKGLIKDASMLVGIVVGYILSIFLGMVDFSPIGSAKWLALPTTSMTAFGPLEFRFDTILMFLILYLIVSIQLVGDFTVSASAIGKDGRKPTNKELTGGIIGTNLISGLSALFGSFPVATYSQNGGVIVMNRAVSRKIFKIAGLILLLAGFSPKVGALFSTIPNAVVGGGTIVVFSMIAMSGIDLVTSGGFTHRKKLIVGLGLAFGLGVVYAPTTVGKAPEVFRIIFGQSTVVLSTSIAVILNLILPKTEEDIACENLQE